MERCCVLLLPLQLALQGGDGGSSQVRLKEDPLVLAQLRLARVCTPMAIEMKAGEKKESEDNMSSLSPKFLCCFFFVSTTELVIPAAGAAKEELKIRRNRTEETKEELRANERESSGSQTAEFGRSCPSRNRRPIEKRTGLGPAQLVLGHVVDDDINR